MTSPLQQPAHNSHYKPTLRRAVYTIEEDKIIVDYVSRHPNLKTTGVHIWKRMENENVSIFVFIYFIQTYKFHSLQNVAIAQPYLAIYQGSLPQENSSWPSCE